MRAIKVGDITLIKAIGKGQYGVVYKSTKDGRQEYFATKVLKREEMDRPGLKKHLINEINILRELDHPNIYKLIDIKKTEKNYLLVMEYVNGGCLSECLEQYKKKYNASSFTEEIVQYLMRQIIDAFEYIHGKNIMHRDIKLENIMVNFQNENDKNNLNLLNAQIKIIDFGLAIKGFGKTVLGSPLNMDPLILNKYHKSLPSHVCKDKLIYDLKIDIWSLGAICYQMLIGKSVFNPSSLDDLIKKVEEGNYRVPTSLSKEIVSFINGMLQYNPEKRLSAEDLSNHPFLKKDIKKFHKINTNKISKKISHNQLNINVKNNNTIWSIFNEDDEKVLLSIKGSQLKKSNTISQSSINFPVPSASRVISTSFSNNNQTHYSVISNNSNMSNTHNSPLIQTYNNIFPDTSIYGQKMHINNPMQNRQNIQNIQRPNIQNIQRPNREEPHNHFQRLKSGNINPPNEIYNNLNFYRNAQNQEYNTNNIGNLVINKNCFNSNPPNYNGSPEINDFDENKVCIIM